MSSTTENASGDSTLPFDIFVAAAYTALVRHALTNTHGAVIAYEDVALALEYRGDRPLPTSVDELRTIIALQNFHPGTSVRRLYREIWDSYQRACEVLSRVRK